MSAGHTPGPWFIHRPHGTIYIEARLREGILQEVAACGPTEAHGQQEGNAALIASAPDLLAERDRLKAANAELAEALKYSAAALRHAIAVMPSDDKLHRLVDYTEMLARSALTKNQGATT